MTFDSADRVLFSGDAFGGFGTVDEGLFDDEVDAGQYRDEFLRYFSNVLGRYSAMVQHATARLRSRDMAVLATTHGIVWRRDPWQIVDLYDRWNRHELDPGVVIAYASMYGNTRRAVETVSRTLSAHGVPVVVHNLSHTHVSYVLRDIWRSRGVVLASPTYNTGVFPLLDDLTRILVNKNIPPRVTGIVCSFGWAGGAASALQDFVSGAKWELVEPIIEFPGAPDAGVCEQCTALGRALSARCSAK